MTPELLPESSVTVKTNRGQKQVLRFHIGSNQHFQIFVEDRQREVSVTLYGPNREIRSTGCLWGGARISETPIAAAKYGLELQSCDAQSQDEFQVTLRQVRSIAKDDASRVAAELASEEANHLLRDRPSRVTEALSKANDALRQWNLIGDPLEEARAFLAVGILYRNSGMPSEALDTLQQGLTIADSIPLQTERAATRRAIASVYSGTGKLDQALEYVSQARQISMSNSSDKYGVAEAWIVEGDAQYFKSHMNEAAESYKKAHDVFEALHYRRGQARALW